MNLQIAFFYFINALLIIKLIYASLDREDIFIHNEILNVKRNKKMPLPLKKDKKVEEPVGKNKKIGHPKKNSGYAEDQPSPMKNKKRSKKS